MKYTIRYTIGFVTELQKLRDWYDQQDYVLGGRFISEINRISDNIKSFPDLYKNESADLHRAVVTKFSINLYYHVNKTNNEITILAIFHQSRIIALNRTLMLRQIGQIRHDLKKRKSLEIICTKKQQNHSKDKDLDI